MARSLWHLKKGQTRVVAALAEGLAQSLRTRLIELGFHPGAQVTCVVAPSLGAPKLYQVDNAVYSLDHSIASLISLQQSEDSD